MNKEPNIYSFFDECYVYYGDYVKEIDRLNNKVEELMTLYTTEREVKEDYRSIIKEVREYIENNDIMKVEKEGKLRGGIFLDKGLLEILDKGSE